MKNRSDIAETKRPSVFRRLLAILLVTALLIAGAGYGALYILLKGPSAYAGSAFAAAVVETPVGELALRLFLTPDEVAACKQAEQSAPDLGSGENRFTVRPFGQ